jgi:hypothetical protein
MKKLSIQQMENLEGGRWKWKCWLGIGSIAAGVILAISGVGTAIAGGAVGGGLGLVNSNC